MLHRKTYAAAHLRLIGLEPVGGQPLMSVCVTRGQCDARPTVTFPAARHHRLLVGTKLLLDDKGTCELTTCPGFALNSGRLGFELATYPSELFS